MECYISRAGIPPLQTKNRNFENKIESFKICLFSGQCLEKRQLVIHVNLIYETFYCCGVMAFNDLHATKHTAKHVIEHQMLRNSYKVNCNESCPLWKVWYKCTYYLCAQYSFIYAERVVLPLWIIFPQECKDATQRSVWVWQVRNKVLMSVTFYHFHNSILFPPGQRFTSNIREKDRIFHTYIHSYLNITLKHLQWLYDYWQDRYLHKKNGYMEKPR